MGMAEGRVMISHGVGQETWWAIAKAQHEPAVTEGSSGKDFGYSGVDLECEGCRCCPLCALSARGGFPAWRQGLAVQGVQCSALGYQTAV